MPNFTSLCGTAGDPEVCWEFLSRYKNTIYTDHFKYKVVEVKQDWE
jgi:hypothetical protein